jgi:hypothetical protein
MAAAALGCAWLLLLLLLLEEVEGRRSLWV